MCVRCIKIEDIVFNFQVLLLIGENFENSDEICGAVVNVRPKVDKIGKFQNKNLHFLSEIT